VVFGGKRNKKIEKIEVNGKYFWGTSRRVRFSPIFDAEKNRVKL
jgi:hypothetical protein